MNSGFFNSVATSTRGFRQTACKRKRFCMLWLFLFAVVVSTEVLSAEKFRRLEGAHEVCRPAALLLDDALPREELPFTVYGLGTGEGSVILPSGLSAYPFEDFDFDNDGVVDRVFARHEAGSYIFGTILFVAFGRKGETEAEKKEVLTAADVKIFPCQFDKRIAGSGSCPMVSQDGDEAGIAVTIGSTPSVVFRGRYTDIHPIQFKKRTYLVLFSRSLSTKNYAGVIEPTGDTSYRSVCLFKKIV